MRRFLAFVALAAYLGVIVWIVVSADAPPPVEIPTVPTNTGTTPTETGETGTTTG